MVANSVPRHALVFGASGFIGRHLILALAASGVRVTTASRSSDSAQRLRRWLADHGVTDLSRDVRVDFGAADLLPEDSSGYADITEIHNCAGSFRFGMSTEEARRANVASVESIVDFAAGLPGLRRLVHVSGYRVGGQDPATVPWSDERVRRTYRKVGAYEASKLESDAVLQARAQERGVAWSIVNASTVIGDSRTGESDQYMGLATNLRDLWRGKVAALPGDSRTFVPVVPVDYVASFMTLLPADDTTANKSYWILDDQTPPLPDLLGHLGTRYRVKVPRARIPVSIIKRLPQHITRADPETLSFLSSDRYPTGPAVALAEKHDLPMPDTMGALGAWADYLAAHRFGDAPAKNRRFTEVAGIRTFELGAASARRVILPGLPGNADTWAAVVASTPDTRAVDLPGLGMSSGLGREDWPAWFAALVPSELHLVGHSIGCAAALEAAIAWPAKVPQLTLVSPFFLQPRGGLTTRIGPLTGAYLRRVRPAALAKRLTGDDAHAPAVESSVSDLRRPGTAARVARLLALASNARWRAELRHLLTRYSGHTHVIVGAQDPLSPAARALVKSLPRVTLTVIPGAGHHPQLTHSAELAHALGAPARARDLHRSSPVAVVAARMLT